MIRRAIVLLATCALIACAKETPAPAPTTTTQSEEDVASTVPPPEDSDSDNLLNLGYGASVVSRTGELSLENSAAHAIDGNAGTFWLAPNGAVQKTLVYSLLSAARVRAIGISTSLGSQAAGRVRFDASMDGHTWRELIAMPAAKQLGRQIVNVPPTTLRYLRVEVVEPANTATRLYAIHVLGDEVEPPATPSFGGCWTINGLHAVLEQHGARVTGVIESDPPTILDGGTDNRVAYVMWNQGPTWGYAVLTRTPDGAHLTGLKFYELFDLKHLGDAFFGDRCTDTYMAATAPAWHPKQYSLYGLAFDSNDRLIDALSAAQLASLPRAGKFVAHEHRFETAEDNRKHATARLASLREALQKRGADVARYEFLAVGSEGGDPPIASAVQRRLASRVDIIAVP